MTSCRGASTHHGSQGFESNHTLSVSPDDISTKGGNTERLIQIIRLQILVLLQRES
jgi:hypothetical protein